MFIRRSSESDSTHWSRDLGLSPVAWTWLSPSGIIWDAPKYSRNCRAQANKKDDVGETRPSGEASGGKAGWPKESQLILKTTYILANILSLLLATMEAYLSCSFVDSYNRNLIWTGLILRWTPPKAQFHSTI